jgi:acetylglutamate kinase
VASPLNLLAELFTVKGAGTLIKAGTTIERRASYADVDPVRLVALLESSFGRRLEREFLTRSPLAIYLEASYRGAAILHPSPIAPFLSKFAVEPVAQGEGIGQDLWQAIIRDHAAVYWRSRPENPIASWYARICDGMVRMPSWHVFWRGVAMLDVPRMVEQALAQPSDFTD